VLIKIEIIILVIIIILSFITGIIINIIDVKNGKEIKKNNKSEIDAKYEEEVNKALSKVIINEEDVLEGKTIVNINIPKVRELETESPKIIKSIPLEGTINTKKGE
jgi:hypothetical protein